MSLNCNRLWYSCHNITIHTAGLPFMKCPCGRVILGIVNVSGELVLEAQSLLSTYSYFCNLIYTSRLLLGISISNRNLEGLPSAQFLFEPNWNLQSSIEYTKKETNPFCVYLQGFSMYHGNSYHCIIIIFLKNSSTIWNFQGLINSPMGAEGENGFCIDMQ